MVNTKKEETKENFIRKYGIEISILIAVLGLTGFNLNIPEWYKSLSVDAKIVTFFVLNLIITFYLISRVKK